MASEQLEIKKIFVIGGTGAQGVPAVKALAEGGKFHLRLLTRDVNNHRAQELAALPNVELVAGTFTDEESVRKGYQGCDGAWVNVNGFALGEPGEIYAGIRMYELAREAGIKFYVFANLDYGYKKGGYDPKYRCGHYDGKGRVPEWILAQPSKPMASAIFTTGPYFDMALAHATPMSPSIIDGVVTWSIPLGDGAVPHIALQDVGFYVRWLFTNPVRATGMDLEVATEHVHYADLAAAFTRVTGAPARYVPITFDEFWAGVPAADLKVGTSNTTWRQNFTGFYNLWRDSGRNQGVIRRDYKLLDEIHPNRIRSAEEFLRSEEADALWKSLQAGGSKSLLKMSEDGGSLFGSRV